MLLITPLAPVALSVPLDLLVSPQMIASVIALITFIGLAVGHVPGLRLNRATLAMIGAGAVLLLGVTSLKQAEGMIDLSTIILLFSMMVLIAVLETAGFFGFVGDIVIKRARSPFMLLVLVVVTAGILSMLFLNDPVCLMLTSLICGVVRRLRRDPLPYLIALATASNVGSAATITGNPQNILIGTSSGIPYLVFLARCGPIAVIGLVIVWAVIWLLFPREFRARGNSPRETSGETGQTAPDAVSVLANKSVSARANHQTGPEAASAAEDAEPPGPYSGDPGQTLEVDKAPPRVDGPTLRKSLIVIALTLIAFLAGVNVTLAVFIAACAILISRRIESDRILTHIDWPLLVMFGGLFIVTGSLTSTGVSDSVVRNSEFSTANFLFIIIR